MRFWYTQQNGGWFCILGCCWSLPIVFICFQTSGHNSRGFNPCMRVGDIPEYFDHQWVAKSSEKERIWKVVLQLTFLVFDYIIASKLRRRHDDRIGVWMVWGYGFGDYRDSNQWHSWVRIFAYPLFWDPEMSCYNCRRDHGASKNVGRTRESEGLNGLKADVFLLKFWELERLYEAASIYSAILPLISFRNRSSLCLTRAVIEHSAVL